MLLHGPDHSVLGGKARRSMDLLELSMMAIERTTSLSRELDVPSGLYLNGFMGQTSPYLGGTEDLPWTYWSCP